MKKMNWTAKKKLIMLFLIAIVIVVGVFVAGNINAPSTNARAREHAEAALEYCKANGLRTDYCILVDFDVHSGKNRFFVWDFTKHRIVYSTICEHGRGGKSTHRTPEFSNKCGSKCTSLGKYHVLNKRHMYNHPSVPCYVLKGVDSTNSNAMARGILIHPSVNQIPTFPFPLHWRTEGCFGLSLRGFDIVDEYKQMSSKPMLLWAYK